MAPSWMPTSPLPTTSTTALRSTGVEPALKHEPISETDDGPVKVVVAHLQGDCRDLDKDVLIEFYTPWYGHYKNLAPIYEKLGGLTAVRGDRTLETFVEFITENAVNKFEVKVDKSRRRRSLSRPTLNTTSWIDIVKYSTVQ
ncbi:hypothetical protein BGZ65_008796 [Modicella reniformis]|uniref:protein disulfide-isomerase n=1 Tax=Modicella reniformis TaxID=1440133 RepID=A0A9P6MB19_9FUNG|nr:hypothetical protein BGZ65_008796 [Modicella reniformis]